MWRILKALKRLWDVITFKGAGRIDKQRKKLSKDPAVINAIFEESKTKLREDIQSYSEAAAGFIKLQEEKAVTKSGLVEKEQKLSLLIKGTQATMKKKMAQLQAQGTTDPVAIRSDVVYQKCSTDFKDFSSSLKQIQEDIAEADNDIKRYQENIDNNRIQLRQLKRKLDGLEEKRAGTIADVISAEQEKKMNDIISGVSTEGIAQTLREMDELRAQVKAEARVSRELAATDVDRSIQEYETAARDSEAQSEFDKLIGLPTEVPEVQEEAPPEAKLPE